MTLDRIELGRAVTFMKRFATIVSLIFPTKSLIWNKITFTTLNSLNLAELVVNEPTKSIYKKKLNILFSIDLSLLNVKVSRAYN